MNFLFVYGTLRRSCRNPRLGDFEDHVTFVDYGSVQGKLFRVSWYPAAVPSGFPHDSIAGEVYDFSGEPDYLAVMDRYEGFIQDDLPGSEYLRRTVKVKLASGNFVDAWIYWFNRPVDGLEPLPDGDFCRKA